MATTRKTPVAAEVASARPMLLVRFLIGSAIIVACFLVVPELPLETWARWTIAGVAFVGGNLLRPLYRTRVLRKDRAFAGVIETIHFALVAIAIAAALLVLRQFTWASVARVLLDTWVLACGAAFFVLVALRDLLYRWREVA